MNKHAIRWSLAAVLVAGGATAGYILGRSEIRSVPTAPLAQEGTPASDGADSTALNSALTDDGTPVDGGTPRPTAAAEHVDDVSPSTAQEIIDRFDDVLVIEDYGVRRYHNEILFDNMTAEQAPEIFEALSKLPQRAKEAQLMLFFFQGWGRVDGPAAVQASLGVENRGRVGLAAAALTAWSWSDPHAAWNTAAKLAEGWPMLGSRLGGIVTELAKEDLGQTIALRDDVEGARAAGSIQSGVIEFAIEERRVDALLDQVAQFESVDDQKKWLHSLFASWGRIEDDAPLALLENITDPVLAESAMGGFLNGWTASDPEGALDYLLAHPDNPASDSVLPNALRQTLYYGDRETTLDVIERVAATGELDTLAPRMMSSLASAQPEIALKLASMLSDEKQRERYTGMAVGNWARNDYEAATTYYEQLPDGAARTHALPTLAYTTFPREDGGERMARWLEAVPAGDDRTRVVETLLQIASSRHATSSESSLRVLRQIAGETPDLSERAQEAANKLFGEIATTTDQK